MEGIEGPPAAEPAAPAGRLAMLRRILATTRGRIISALVVVALAGVVVWASLAILGLGGPAFAGQVRFGAYQGMNVCDVGDAVEVLPSGSLMFWSAVFSTTVPIGHELVIERAKDGVIEKSDSFVADRAVDCMGTPIAAGPLYTGMYTLTIRDGTTVLATGSLAIR